MTTTYYRYENMNMGSTAPSGQTAIWLFLFELIEALHLINNKHFTGEFKLLETGQLLLPWVVFLLQLTLLVWFSLQVHCSLGDCPGQLTSWAACHPPAAWAQSWNPSAASWGLTSRGNKYTVFKQPQQEIMFYSICELYFLFNCIS